jgi:DNA-directed RNA polymerase specialized sigma24 family protein
VATDFTHPLSKRALQALDERVMRPLRKFALMKAGSDVLAEDLLQEARNVLCNPDRKTGGRPWDPERGSLLAHMRVIVHNIARNEWRSARSRRVALDGGVAGEEMAAHPDEGPDALSHDQRQLETQRELGRILRSRLSGLPLQVFDRLCADDAEACEQMASALGCTVKQIYDANRVIAYHGSKVKAEYEEAERLRLEDLRSRATNRRG